VIETAERRWTIPTYELHKALADWRAHPDAGARRKIADRLRLARAHAASFAAGPTEASGSRAALAAILARKEFRAIGGPNWFDQLRERALRWLVGLLQRIVGSSAFPTISRLAVYVLILVAVIATALWMFRALRRSAATEATALQIDVVPPRSWAVWLAQARDAASQNDWREAVRHAYWCGIAWLETRGAWRPDPSRTPREYLRLLPASNEHARALRTLTVLTEHVWYGAAPAGAAQFEDALARLTDLGCPIG